MVLSHLVVTLPFGRYAIGEHITDEAEIAKVRVSNPHHVVPITTEEPARPQKKLEAKIGKAELTDKETI